MAAIGVPAQDREVEVSRGVAAATPIFDVADQRYAEPANLKLLQEYFAGRPADPYFAEINPGTLSYDLRHRHQQVADDIIERQTWQVAFTYDPIHIPEPIAWNVDPEQNDRSQWALFYHSFALMEHFVVSYQATGDRKYLDYWMPVIESYAASNPMPKGMHASAWNDHVTAERAAQIMYWFEHLRLIDYDPQFLSVLLPFLADHGVHLLDPAAYTRRHNHGYFVDKSLIMMASNMAEMPQSAEWLETGQRRVVEQLDYLVNDEGVFREHSPSYHSGFIPEFMKFQQMLDFYGVTLSLDLDARIRSMLEFAGWLYLPEGNGRVPRLGDTRKTVSFATFRLRSEPGALYSATQGAEGTKPDRWWRVWPESGYAIMRDGWHAPDRFADSVYVCFVAAYFSRWHKHADDLSLVVAGYGTVWLIDGGKRDYTGSPMDRFLISNRAHNVLILDHESTPISDAAGAGDFVRLTAHEQLDADTFEVKGESRLYSDAVWERTVRYRRPHEIIVRDRVDTSRTRRWEVLYQVDPAKQVTVDGDGRVLLTDPAIAGVALELTLRDEATREQLKPKIVQGQEEPELLGWSSPDAGNDQVPTPVILWSGRGSTIRLVTEMRFVVTPPARPLPRP
jgi:hypothetical protein